MITQFDTQRRRRSAIQKWQVAKYTSPTGHRKRLASPGAAYLFSVGARTGCPAFLGNRAGCTSLSRACTFTSLLQPTRHHMNITRLTLLRSAIGLCALLPKEAVSRRPVGTCPMKWGGATVPEPSPRVFPARPRPTEPHRHRGRTQQETTDH
jgi:hypothetical protein